VPDLNSLVEMEHDDPEMVPEILPVDARLSITAPVERLRTLFSRCASVAAASTEREVIAGTSNVLLEAVRATSRTVAFLRATATDGEKTVSVVADSARVAMEGKVLLPAARMNEILKLAPDEMARIEVIGTQATVRSGRALWTVQVAPGDALSVYLDTSGVQTSPVSLGPFTRALSAARKAASTSSAREALMQVLLRNGSFTACDGGRVHRALAAGLDETLNVTIPVGAVDEILKAAKAPGVEYAEFGYDENHVVFETNAGRIVAQRMLIDFPAAVENLLLGPAFTNTNVLQVKRQDLIDTIKRVRINANPDSAAITLGLVAGRGGELELSVRARDAARNSSQETLESVWLGSESKLPEITVNHHYLVDLLEVYPGETVQFKVGEDSKTTKTPLLIEDEKVGFVGIVQQMYSLR
jgi:DNA polymerase III sliding clamp (beta) subunit (PCNA family)